MDNQMPSIPTSPHKRALRFSLVSGLLTGLLELLGTPPAPALSDPHPSLLQKQLCAAAVRRCATHGHPEAQPRRHGHVSSRPAPGQLASWVMGGNATAEPCEPGPDSEDFPAPLEIVPSGVLGPALARMSVHCLRIAGAELLRVTTVQSRAPPWS